MNTPMFRRVTEQVLFEMKNAGFIEHFFSSFLLSFPHYQKISKDLKRGCELACSACALSAAIFSCRDSSAATRELITKVRAELRGSQRAKGSSEIAEIMDYLEPLSYIHYHDALKNRSAHRVSSSLSTIGLMAVTRVIQKHRANSLYKSETRHLLQELMLPLLLITHQKFANKQSTELDARFSGLC